MKALQSSTGSIVRTLFKFGNAHNDSSIVAQWDKVDNKTTVALYGGGALVALWLSSTIVGAINSVPLVRDRARPEHTLLLPCAPIAFALSFPDCLTHIHVYLQLPKAMELIGLGYTGWFVYRYLLFKVIVTTCLWHRSPATCLLVGACHNVLNAWKRAALNCWLKSCRRAGKN